MLNTSNIGKRIIQIKGGHNDGLNIYVGGESLGGKGEFKHLRIKDDGKFQFMPYELKDNEDLNNNRQTILISGISGSGKTTWINNYIKEYNKILNSFDKKNNIKDDKNDKNILFVSAFNEHVDVIKDNNIDDNIIQRIKISDSLYTNPIQLNEIMNKCLVFDDIDTIKDKNITGALYDLIDEGLEIGRKFNITLLYSSHMLSDNKKIRFFIHECDLIVFFVANFNARYKYMIENYTNLDKDDIYKIKHSKSRWCCIYKKFPNLVILEKEIWIAGCLNS